MVGRLSAVFSDIPYHILIPAEMPVAEYIQLRGFRLRPRGEILRSARPCVTHIESIFEFAVHFLLLFELIIRPPPLRFRAARCAPLPRHRWQIYLRIGCNSRSALSFSLRRDTLCGSVIERVFVGRFLYLKLNALFFGAHLPKLCFELCNRCFIF